MSITLTWLGHACFKLETAGYALVIDPYTKAQGYDEFQTPANAVICSHGHGDHAFKEAVRLENPEAESPFTITALPTFHDPEGGTLRGPNLIHLIECHGLRIAHCGDLGHRPDSETLAALGSLDVLMVPVGGHYTIDAATAHALAETLAPRVVIPMHYRRGALGFPVLAELNDFLALRGDVGELSGSCMEITAEMPPQTAVLQYIRP